MKVLWVSTAGGIQPLGERTVTQGTFGGLSRLEGKLCSRPVPSKQGHSSMGSSDTTEHLCRPWQQQLCSRTRDRVLSLGTCVAMHRSMWKCPHTAGKGGSHPSLQTGSPVVAGDADTKALIVFKHSGALGPVPGSRLQPGESCSEQMLAPRQSLPAGSLCSWWTWCPACGCILHSGVLGSALGSCSAWLLRVFPSPLLPGAQARWTHGQEVPR